MKIKEIRKSKKFSQGVLAEMAGLSTAAISSYELGNRSPDANSIANIAQALGVTIGELFGEQAPTNEIIKKESTGDPYLDIIRNLSGSVAELTKDSNSPNTKSYGETIAQMGNLLQTGMDEQVETNEQLSVKNRLIELHRKLEQLDEKIISFQLSS